MSMHEPLRDISICVIRDGWMPTRAHKFDAGLDLKADLASPGEKWTINPNGRVVVPTGVIAVIPEHYAGFIHPRSGLAAKSGVTVANAPGTVDAGYLGEIKVILVNHGADPVQIHDGDRIAQLVIQRVELPVPIEISMHEIESSERGDGGFGSSGR